MKKSEKVKKARALSADEPIYAIVLRYAAWLVILCVMWRARVGGISPFATGFYLALCLTGQSAPLLLPLYVLSAAATTNDFVTLIAAVNTAVAVTAVTAAAKRLGKSGAPLTAVITSAVGQAAYAYFALRGGEDALYVALSTLFSLMFAYVAVIALRPIVRDRLRRPPTNAELACMGITLAVFSAGLSSLNVFGFKPVYALAAFIVSAAAYFAGRGSAAIVAGCVGAGCALYTFDLWAMALIFFVALVYGIFAGAARMLAAAAATTAVAFFELYFGTGGLSAAWDMAAVMAGCAAFALIRRRTLERLRARFFRPHPDIAVRELICDAKSDAAEELGRVGAVFGEMSRALRSGIKRSSGGEEEIFAALRSGICDKCGGCERRRGEADEALMRLAGISALGGRAGVTDVPFFLQADCPHAARILSAAGEYAARLRRISDEAKRENGLREELAAQLDGVRAIIGSAAEKTAALPSFDTGAERLLKEELSYRGIGAADALIGTDGEVTLVVRSDTLDEEKLLKTANGVMKTAYFSQIRPSAASGFSVVRLREKTAFDAVFGCGCVARDRTASGDKHSFVRIGESKFMMALCDGKGCGSEAGRISETAIGLVESFYRAGFPGDFIIRQVNRFLSSGSDESFAAFDVLVCDLNTLERSIIKLGSPASLIKDGETVTRVEGSALPLGALDELTPSVMTDTARDGQTVIFVSDGVSDLFGGDELAHLVNDLSDLNVRTLCETVTAKALALAGGEPRDDMTVVAARLFRRV